MCYFWLPPSPETDLNYWHSFCVRQINIVVGRLVVSIQWHRCYLTPWSYPTTCLPDHLSGLPAKRGASVIACFPASTSRRLQSFFFFLSVMRIINLTGVQNKESALMRTEVPPKRIILQLRYSIFDITHSLYPYAYLCSKNLELSDFLAFRQPFAS